jgi:hypothetical protein
MHATQRQFEPAVIEPVFVSVFMSVFVPVFVSVFVSVFKARSGPLVKMSNRSIPRISA